MSEIDQHLASESRLEPSSGFTASVMDAVREAAVEPPPLPFPWRRFVAGIALCLGAGGATTFLMLQPRMSAAIDVPALAAAAPAVIYGAAGLLLSVVVIRLTRLLSSP